MKIHFPRNRLQFGLRLMLLLVALMAVTTSWLRARYDVRRLERNPHRANIQAQIEALSMKIDRETDQLSDPDPRKQQVAARNLQLLNKWIAKSQKELRDLDR